MTPPVDWSSGDAPRSSRFGDLYFSAAGGLAESQAVFLGGCGLPEGWRGRAHFTVAELGFGTGLNIAALLDLWRHEGAANGWLSIFSIEAEPLSEADARRAIALWPELSDVAAALFAFWPGRARGFHRVDLPKFRATLDLAVLDVAEALTEWSGPADAWFLDGFAPRLNPQMWRPEVLELVAAKSAPGARLATYTAAGEVRRGLTAAGFKVERKPGFGSKRHRVEAYLSGNPPIGGHPPRVAVVGAGIAGASLFRAFSAQGVEAEVFASKAPAASVGAAALVTPRLDAGLGAPAALFARAFDRARTSYESAAIARGALQLAIGPKDRRRFAAIAASDLFEPGEMALLSPQDAAVRLGEAAPAALAMERALVVDPAPLLDVRHTHAEIDVLHWADGVWRFLSDGGEVIAEAESVIVAAGMESAKLVPKLALRPVRGQASFAAGLTLPIAALFGGYAAPAPGGIVFGATHDRDDETLEPRVADHDRNRMALAAVLPDLAARVAGRPLVARTGVRATTSDYLPLAGRVDGLFVLSGLGSRGFALAPLMADHVAALVLGRPTPLQKTIADLVDPARFAARALRRGPSPQSAA